MDLTGSAGPRSARPPTGLALLLAVLTGGALVTVWTLQWDGYVPCELCLLQREPYYAGVPLALLTAAVARGRRPRLAALGFGLLVALFAVSAGLGVYHAGVEWQLWAGPAGCTGPLTAPAQVSDFLKQLESVKVVRCDAAAMRILGVSLAGWNVVLSLGLVLLAALGLRAPFGRRVT